MSKVKIGVPVLTIVNTLPEFFWLTNYLETSLSNTIWLPITSATTALQYRGILDRAYANRDEENSWFKDWQCHDFSYRGLSSLESACLSGAGHLLSFLGTDTVPAILFLKEYYSVKENTVIGCSVAATEHSVMMAGGDDKETFTRLLTDVYPKGIVSVVSDTWDLWHVVGTILPEIKDLIMSREGKLVVRPDSGSPLLILCGDEKAETELERKGLIEALWDIFGGTVNQYGYRVLDPHIGAIYGDSITPERAKSILFFLARKGFAPSNVVFGVGSFSYQYATRDTYGFAMKATSVVINGIRKAVFKDPKTSKGTIKKSARGLLRVEATTDRGDYILLEDVSVQEEQGGALKIAFSNGAWIPSYDNSLEAIRARVAA